MASDQEDGEALDVSVLGRKGIESDSGMSSEREELRNMGAERAVARECPVPKPGGLLGKFLGFGAKREEERLTIETGRRER